MAKPKLIIHIGHGKTGTSSIQASLAGGASQLVNDRVLYLGFMLENGRNRNRPIWQVPFGDVEFFRGMQADEACKALAEVLSELLLVAEDDGYLKAIWSNEWLLERPGYALPALERLCAAGYTLEIQCYLRRHDAWAQSAYTQWGLKDNELFGDLRPFRDWIEVWKNGTSLNFFDLIEPWRKAFGQSFRLFNYDDKPDVVAHFLSINNLPQLPTKTENRAPDSATLAAWALLQAGGKRAASIGDFNEFVAAIGAVPDVRFARVALNNLLPRPEDMEKIRARTDKERIAINRVLAENGEPPILLEPPVQLLSIPDAVHVQEVLARSTITLDHRLNNVVDHLNNRTQELAKSEAEFTAVRRDFHETCLQVQTLQNKLNSRTDELANSEASLVEVKLNLQEAGVQIEALRSERDSCNHELANSESNLAIVKHTLHLTWLQTQTLQNDLNSRTHELYQARSLPLRNLKKQLEFRALKLLSSHIIPLPPKMKLRFIRSANKRNPDRYAPQFKSEVPTPSNDSLHAFSAQGGTPFRSDVPSVLIVTHDASRTGAPIVALNIAKALSARYNVVTVCLRGGDLVSDFRQVSTELYVAKHEGERGTHFARILDPITAQKTPTFAIVNSIESRHILGTLRKRQIPSVALLHEFASYTLPKSAFTDAFYLADEIVFSSELTIRNAIEQTSFVRSTRFHVLAQGRCEVPRHDSNDAIRRNERDSLTAQLRPFGDSAREFLVIGAGYVQIRKGIDLFIDVARRVLATKDGENARFAWIGAGYNPEHDAAYSVYLRDQIDRAGLTDRMIMLEETSEIEHVYALSNLLLLTSRLDPLPNVAIDALSEGVPVVCFDKTTGIADLLTNAGLREACVADYLDTAQAAEKVLQFIRSPEAYRQARCASKDFAMRVFNFDGYVSRIEELGLRVRNATSSLPDDAAMIVAADDFDPAFLMPSQKRASTKMEAVDYYLNESWREALPRRPEPGFNPFIYARHLDAEGVTEVTAYAAFLRRGRPPGPWLRPVIRESSSRLMPSEKEPLRTALHIHAFYPEVIATIAHRLALNETQPDLFINAADRKSLEAAVKTLEGYRGRIADARVVVNRGRDIGPFLTEFGRTLVRDYDLIGHVHTKKSAVLADREAVERWVGFLYENMIGGKRGGPMIDRIVAAFTQNNRLGIVFPSDPNVLAWSKNEDAALKLVPQLGLEKLPEFFDFPVGSMFWLSAAALEPFVALGLDWKDYPPEPAPYDGTILHAIERLFGVVPENRGLELAVTNVKGVTR